MSMPLQVVALMMPVPPGDHIIAMGLSPEFLLNCLWILLAGITVPLLLLRRSDRGNRHLILLSTLTCVFVLLFPMFSANDDQAQQELLGDGTSSQVVIKLLKSGTQPDLCPCDWFGAAAMPIESTKLSSDRRTADLFLVPAPYLLASGIHSPPYC